MLLYLSGHSRPDIAFAVHPCARYTFKPTRRHELALIRIGRYLKGTMNKGMVLTPSDSPQVDCYPDADFAGLYGHESSQDPHCARSRTGYVITAFDCPVLWKSRLQTEIYSPVHDGSRICGTQYVLQRFIPHRWHGSRAHSRRQCRCSLTLAGLELCNQIPLVTRAHSSPLNQAPQNWHQQPIGRSLYQSGLTRVSFERLRFLLMGWWLMVHCPSAAYREGVWGDKDTTFIFCLVAQVQSSSLAWDLVLEHSILF